MTEMAAAMQAAILPKRGIVRVGGPEAREFLQGLVSNDMGQAAPDRALYAALLSPQGKILFDFLIVEHDGVFLLDCERARVGDLVKRLRLYKLRAKVDIEDSADWTVAALWGPGAAERFALEAEPGTARPALDGIAFVDPRGASLGLRAFLPAESASASLANLGFTVEMDQDYDRHRLTLGVGEGSRDLGIEALFLLEANAEPLHAVDFRKGCYVGQELTARMKHRATVRKRLLPVRFEGPPPVPGDRILAGTREVGTLRSVLDGTALALIRLDALKEAGAEGLPLVAGEARLFVDIPDWLVPFLSGGASDPVQAAS